MEYVWEYLPAILFLCEMRKVRTNKLYLSSSAVLMGCLSNYAAVPEIRDMSAWNDQNWTLAAQMLEMSQCGSKT